jgi:hypothetical protein
MMILFLRAEIQAATKSVNQLRNVHSVLVALGHTLLVATDYEFHLNLYKYSVTTTGLLQTAFSTYD